MMMYPAQSVKEKDIYDFSEMSDGCGYYLLYDKDGDLIYIGSTDNLRETVRIHFNHSERNPAIKGIAEFCIVVKIASVEDAEEWKNGICTAYEKSVGELPAANRILTPEEMIPDAEESEHFQKTPQMVQI